MYIILCVMCFCVYFFFYKQKPSYEMRISYWSSDVCSSDLYPRGRLPLHIFEPRYRTMIRDAMAGDRVIGMVQPREHGESHPVKGPPLFAIGGLGRISQCTETNDEIGRAHV